MRKRRLATGSLYDTDWQTEEYRRLMGDDAADRQIHATKLEAGACTCHAVTVKTRGLFRTIHQQGCIKWKPYMEEHQALADERRKGGHRESGKAHAAAARRHDTRVD